MTSANDRLPKRASDWLIALADRPEDSVLKAGFERWLAANPDNRREWDETNHAWRGLGEIGSIAQPGDEAAAAPQPRGVNKKRRQFLRAAAGIALITGAAVLSQFGTLRHWQADHVTGTAELKQVLLSDGSHVELAPRSAMDIKFSNSERRIRLFGGQAFFAVASGDRRPFVVEAGDVEARDIGTEFDVRKTTQGADISVKEGIVEVTVPGAKNVAELRAGEWLSVAGPDAMHRGRSEADQIAAWRSGRLMVQHQPVSAVVDGLRPYFAGSIVLIGERLAKQPTTGVYNLSDPIGALRAVALAQGAEVYQVSPWVLVLASP